MTTAREHDPVPAAGTMRDFAGISRHSELAFDYPVTAECGTCRGTICKPAPGCAWLHDSDTETEPDAPPYDPAVISRDLSAWILADPTGQRRTWYEDITLAIGLKEGATA